MKRMIPRCYLPETDEVIGITMAWMSAATRAVGVARVFDRDWMD